MGTINENRRLMIENIKRMKSQLKEDNQHLNRNSTITEINWAKVPFTSAWKTLRAEKKRAEAEANAKEKERELDNHNKRMLQNINALYQQQSKHIRDKYKNMPELMEDKLLYLKDFFWALVNDAGGWDMDLSKKLHKSGKFDAEFKRVMKHETNPRGAVFPAWALDDVLPDLQRISSDEKFAKGYKKELQN